MDVTALQSAYEGNGVTNSRQADLHNYALRVQSAVGPKHLDGRGLQGRVVVAYSISENGTLQVARVSQSSGEQRLDSEALRIVMGAAFPSPPGGLGAVHRSFISAFTFE